MHYNHLQLEEREKISDLLHRGQSIQSIAQELCRSVSTVSREVNRHGGRENYRAHVAQKRYQQNQRKSRNRISESTWELVENQLRREFSPEQISGRCQLEKRETVSHESIYQYIRRDRKSGGTLYKYLRCQKKRRKRYGSREKRGQIADMKPIESRPASAENRSRQGHIEGDLVIGKQGTGALVTLVDRKTRYTVIASIKSKTADETNQAISAVLAEFPVVHSITFDRGREFAKFKEIETRFGINVYFANPYASYERGTNENTNGLIRQYLPKGCSLEFVDLQYVQHIQDRLNHRPRKTLGFRTPHEVAFKTKQTLLH